MNLVKILAPLLHELDHPLSFHPTPLPFPTFVARTVWDDLMYFLILQEISENIKKILEGAEKLLQSGHYEADLIESIAGSLEQEWKQFAMDISERGNLLACSVGFHKKSEEVSLIQHHYAL